MKECEKLIIGRIGELIKRVREDLHKLERIKIINIITIDVHSRDSVTLLCTKKIQEAESWDWLC